MPFPPLRLPARARHWSLVCALGAGLIALPDAWCAPVVNVKTLYYDVDATTAADLREQVMRQGPNYARGHALGLTRWELAVTLEMHWNDKTCWLTRSVSSANIVMTLPRINPRTAGQLPEQAFLQLQHFRDAVLAHENVHKRHGIAAAAEAEETLAHLPSYPTCDALQDAVHAVTARVSAKYQQQDRAFDEAESRQAPLLSQLRF